MSRTYSRSDRTLRIKPEGWVDDLVFETGLLMDCGQARNGLGVRINNDDGGVLTNDDLVAIQIAINEHFALLDQALKQTNNIKEN